MKQSDFEAARREARAGLRIPVRIELTQAALEVLCGDSARVSDGAFTVADPRYVELAAQFICGLPYTIRPASALPARGWRLLDEHGIDLDA